MQDVSTVFFRGDIGIGHVVVDGEEQWVITDILSIQASDHENFPMEMEAVLQKLNTPSDYDEYEPESRFEDYFNNCDKIKDHDFTFLGETEESDTVCTFVTNLLSISCKKGNMLVEGESSLLVPWNEFEMKDAMKKHKNRKLNVI